MDTAITSEGTRKGAVRWAFNFGEWKPTEQEWDIALSHIEPEEKTRVLKFHRPQKNGEQLVGRHNPDAKSACVGRLLIRKLIHEQLNIPYKDINLKRTKENKPYLANKTSLFPNFNFNVSHAGDYVILGSEPHDLIGVDVMDANRPMNTTLPDFFKNMQGCFTPFEWRTIKEGTNESHQIKQFFVHWTLKEAYIKAVGIGLGFELQRAEFILNDKFSPSSAVVKIDSRLRNDWKFDIDCLGENHIAACALGPPSEAILSYKQTLSSTDSNTAHLSDHAHIPFTILKIQDLIPQP